MPSAIQVKNWQHTVSIEKNLDVISCLEKDERIVDICHSVSLAHSSVCAIRDDADRIRGSAECAENIKCQQSKKGLFV